jgi:hypothetical protein
MHDSRASGLLPAMRSIARQAAGLKCCMIGHPEVSQLSERCRLAVCEEFLSSNCAATVRPGRVSLYGSGLQPRRSGTNARQNH